MQLAGAYARLAKSNRLYQRDHLSGPMLTLPFTLAALVIRLTADADVAASFLDAQSFDLTTTDSLPEDFFTVTPCSSRMMLITVSNSADFIFSSLS